MKLELNDGYIEINKDNTLTLVGDCANTYYFTLHKELRKANLNLEEIKEAIILSIKELI